MIVLFLIRGWNSKKFGLDDLKSFEARNKHISSTKGDFDFLWLENYIIFNSNLKIPEYN